MKIIQVCPRFFPYIGGIETHVFEISKRLAKEHDVCVITTDPSGKLPKEDFVEGVRVKRVRSFAPHEAFFFSPGIYSALKKEHADILHIHSNQALSSFLAFIGMNRANIKKLVFTPHYCPIGTTPIRKVLRKVYDKIQNKIFFGADRVVCVSNYEMELLAKDIKVPREKMIQIPNGINIEEFRNVQSVQNSRKEQKEHDFQILFVSRLEKYKRPQWVLHALKNVTKKFSNKDIHFVIVGKGPYKEALLSLCKELGIESNVTFKEGLPYRELLEEFSKCDVFVLPSAHETFGIVVLEALAFNKPVIVSNNGALPELFGDYGFVIDSIEELEEALSALIENGEKFKVNFDVENYTWDSVADRISKLYERLLE